MSCCKCSLSPFFFLFFLFTWSASLSTASIVNNSRVTSALINATNGRTDINTVIDSWLLIENKVSTYASHWSDMMRDAFLNHSASAGLSGPCASALSTLLVSYKQLQPWAVMMVDSSASFPMSGILEGTLTDFGDYDECFHSGQLNSPVDPQYCTLEGRPLLPARPRFHNLVHPLYNFYNLTRASSSPLSSLFIENVHYFYYITFRLGLCLPRQCSALELNSFISQGECCSCVSSPCCR